MTSTIVIRRLESDSAQLLQSVFVAVGITIDLGWIGGRAVGFDLWGIPGAPFKAGAVGVFDVFVVAFFSFGGTGTFCKLGIRDARRRLTHIVIQSWLASPPLK